MAGDAEIEPERSMKLAQITIELVEHIQQEIRPVGFWQKAQAQAILRFWVVRYLDDQEVMDYDKLPNVADRLVELAKVGLHKLIP